MTLAVAIGLVACTSREDKMLAELKQVDAYIGKKNAMDSIPDSMARRLHDFAVAFPANPKSENYLYTATLLSEKSGRFFETAKWCEDYINAFPKGKFMKAAMVAAAFNFEKSGTFDKAILYYEKIYKTYPDAPEADDARRNATFLKLGLLTPEQQFEYTQKQKDSAGKK
jgi:TolA-binding protein